MIVTGFHGMENGNCLPVPIIAVAVAFNTTISATSAFTVGVRMERL